MTSTPDRRDLIADAVLDIVATDGIRALTHRAVDRHLDLPLGSTSYYFRTRRDLMAAAVEHLTAVSRRDFAGGSVAPTRELPERTTLAAAIAAAVDTTLATRGRDLRARYALALEMLHDKDIQSGLAKCFFSVPLATDLVAGLGSDDPAADAASLVALLEGLVLDRVVGAGAVTGPPPGTTESVSAIAAGVLTHLRGIGRDPDGARQRVVPHTVP